jgi:hypothetical protein
MVVPERVSSMRRTTAPLGNDTDRATARIAQQRGETET